MKKNIFIIILLSLTFMVLLAFSITQTRLLYFFDLSMAKPVETPAEYQGVYLVSYGDSPGDPSKLYIRNQKALSLSAVKHGIDHIFQYRRYHLDKDFMTDNKKPLSLKKGAGYWVWKPWIILDACNQAPEGSIIIYSDAGNVFKKPVFDLLEKMGDASALFVQQRPSQLPMRVQSRTLKLLNCDEKCQQETCIWAGFMIFRNNSTIRSFLKKWLESCKIEDAIMDDLSPNRKQHPSFQFHLHDQSILSVTNAQNNFGQKYVSVDEVEKTAIWVHRSHVNTAQYISSLGHILAKDIRGKEREFYNRIVAPYLHGWFR